MVKRHYGGLATREEADKFLALGPDSVGKAPVRRVVSKLHPLINWPPDDELARLAQELPLCRIGLQLGCDGSSVKARCRKLGIPTRGRGGWTKQLQAEREA